MQAQVIKAATEVEPVCFGPGIWLMEGPVVPFVLGFHYPTRMVVIRLETGDLFVWSPIALTAAVRRAVDALGPVRFLVAPNLLHHLFLGEWRAAYPGATLCAAPGLRRRRKDLDFDIDLDDVPDPGWAAEIDQVAVGGSAVMTEIVFFHRPSGAAIFADLIESLPSGWFTGWRGVVARLDGITARAPGAPREFRASFLNRRKARAALGRILDWPIERVVIAHGAPVTEDAKGFVRNAFGWLGL